MAGHSKWANIQHRKNRQDAKRGKLFTRFIREISVAARDGEDVSGNPRLRLAVDKALCANMSKDVIERAIRRGSTHGEGEDFENITYEGYGVGGVAVLVECMTDNRNRTVAEVRHAFSKHGGSLGTTGSVAYLFKQVGVIGFSEVDEDKLLEAALDIGVEDIVSENKVAEVLVNPQDLLDKKNQFQAAGFVVDMFASEMRPETYVELDEEGEEKFNKLLNAIEELSDVQNVYANVN
ncbi:MAG: YebC/PmpR family DNA-binding transcriptional regulator [Candidatus Oxydemutatoraceae bacterium WSBS_2016_MAG_OTU14]